MSQIWLWFYFGGDLYPWQCVVQLLEVDSCQINTVPFNLICQSKFDGNRCLCKVVYLPMEWICSGVHSWQFWKFSFALSVFLCHGLRLYSIALVYFPPILLISFYINIYLPLQYLWLLSRRYLRLFSSILNFTFFFSLHVFRYSLTLTLMISYFSPGHCSIRHCFSATGDWGIS